MRSFLALLAGAGFALLVWWVCVHMLPAFTIIILGR